MPGKDTTFDRIQKHIFEDSETALVVLNEKELIIKKRFMAVFTHWSDNPQYTDKQLIQYMIDNFDIERSQAYRDLPRIKMMLGNVRNASKEWHRYTVIELLKHAYQVAEKLEDAKAMAMAADKIGKYTRLDQVEAEAIPWDNMIPPNFEPTPDITILNLPADPNLEERIRKMKRKYSDEITKEPEETEYTEA